MRQLLQNLHSGATTLADVPLPSVSGPNLLVETRATVVSAGTERMLVEFGRSNLLEKARRQPDKVRQVLDKVRTDGISPAWEAVRAKLEAPIPLGYSHAGIVVEIGTRSGGFKVGDRVVTNGPHAEYVRVPFTLAAKIPDRLDLEAAAFTPIAAIGLQGIRLAEPTMGETVVVFGLGLIGLLCVQMLRANGCQVIGIDRNPSRIALAERFGARVVEAGDDAAAQVTAMTRGVGADAVLLTLASSSDEPIHQAAQMSRKRGRLVLVGATGLNLAREDFYRKEISLTVSCSYGPGRYDPAYEDAARDYPLPFVRWTEQRNFEAVLSLMDSGLVDPEPLITHRFSFEDAPAAYDVITGDAPSLGVVLSYAGRGAEVPSRAQRTLDLSRAGRVPRSAGCVGVIGAGNFATRTLLPILHEDEVRLRTIASGGGTSGAIAGRKFGFERTTTDLDTIFGDDEIDTVFVLSRHDSHAAMAIQALLAGKHVFVEKPLALTLSALEAVEQAAKRSERLLMVGFNRRFAPLTTEVQRYSRSRAGPMSVIATVNAGAIPRDHWTQDPEVGGGRIVGEACHWIDLARALVREEIEDVRVLAAHDRQGQAIDDIAHISIRFADGSTAVVHYLANGANSFPKERIECFWDGKTIAIDNWRRMQRFGVPGPLFERTRRMDKGHRAEIRAFMRAVRETGIGPIPLAELLEVSRWAIHASHLVHSG